MPDDLAREVSRSAAVVFRGVSILSRQSGRRHGATPPKHFSSGGIQSIARPMPICVNQLKYSKLIALIVPRGTISMFSMKMKFTIMVYADPNGGFTAFARDIHSVVWCSKRYASESGARDAAKIWAADEGLLPVRFQASPEAPEVVR